MIVVYFLGHHVYAVHRLVKKKLGTFLSFFGVFGLKIPKFRQIFANVAIPAKVSGRSVLEFVHVGRKKL